MRDFLRGMSVILVSLAVVLSGGLAYRYYKTPKELPAISEEVDIPLTYSLIEDVYIFDAVKGLTFTLPIEEYIAGCILAHPIDDPQEEFLKAQAVMFYTYILGRRAEELSRTTPELMGADISTDVNSYLPFECPQEKNIAELKPLISEVLGAYIAYEGVPIQPAFCKSSGGRTQAAKTVFGKDYPYLRSVESRHDSGYTTVTTYTKAEVFGRLSTAKQGFDLYTDPTKWLEVTEAEADGYITEISVDGRYPLSGREVAAVLNLPSAKFSVTYNVATECFTFTSFGEGQLVGLSMYGANEMARQGKGWREILLHYYSGVEIINGGNS